MSKSATIQARIEPHLKNQAESVFGASSPDRSSAFDDSSPESNR